MNKGSNPRLKANAQKLRKGMTKEEKHLWYDFLKGLSVTVNRQKVIGGIIADFYIASAKLVIEIDGAQHYSEEHSEKDSARDAYLRSNGFRVLRFSNQDINRSFDSVCNEIRKWV